MIVSTSPLSAFDSRIACRSEPAPLSLVLVTTRLRPAGVTVVVSKEVLSPGVDSALPDATLATRVTVPPAAVTTSTERLNVSPDGSDGTGQAICWPASVHEAPAGAALKRAAGVALGSSFPAMDRFSVVPDAVAGPLFVTAIA